MQILLANAKIMNDPLRLPQGSAKWEVTEPRFQDVADVLAHEMARMDIDELARQLDCSRKLAAENWMRYQEFDAAKKMPALLAYNGQAYKHLRAASLTDEALQFGQQHLWITCFLYGLLRPLDAVVPYRMEHCVMLEATGDKPVNQWWRTPQPPLRGDNIAGGHDLTQTLIDSVKADDGILIHLSTEEYEHLFDWKRVKEEITVIQPLFYVRDNKAPLAFRRGVGGEAGNLKMQAVWAKSCRGAMTRFILQQQLLFPEELKAFSYEGFEYAPELGDVLHPHFVRG